MAIRVVTPPAAEPVSLAEIKAHMRVEHSDDDMKLGALVAAARNHLEELTGRAFVSQILELVLDAFPGSEIAITKGPVLSIVQVAYDDADGYEQIIPADAFDLDNLRTPAWILPADIAWPTPIAAANSVRIRYEAGYGSPDEVPPGIKQAIMLLAGHWYEYRTEAAERAPTAIPFGVMALISPYRAWF